MTQSPTHNAAFDLRPTVAIIGYGSQGRAHALNLRDAGFQVKLGLRAGGPSAQQAEADGFTVFSPAEAVKEAELVAMLTPDMVQPQVYSESLEPTMAEGACLLFAHGFNMHYDLIAARADLDVVLVAPKGPGKLVRSEYERGRGVPCLYAVQQDATGKAENLALAYAAGLGGARAQLIKTTFKEETETDLFGEQAVLCGGATELVQAGFETLVKAGYQPEVAYYECMHELKLIVDLFYEGGLTRMHEFVSDTAQYGSLTRGSYVINDKSREQMEQVLQEIQDGTFAKEWVAEYEAGSPNYQAKKQAILNGSLEQVGEKMRAQMKWLHDDAENSTESAGQNT